MWSSPRTGTETFPVRQDEIRDDRNLCRHRVSGARSVPPISSHALGTHSEIHHDLGALPPEEGLSMLAAAEEQHTINGSQFCCWERTRL